MIFVLKDAKAACPMQKSESMIVHVPENRVSPGIPTVLHPFLTFVVCFWL